MHLNLKIIRFVFTKEIKKESPDVGEPTSAGL